MSSVGSSRRWYRCTVYAWRTAIWRLISKHSTLSTRLHGQIAHAGVEPLLSSDSTPKVLCSSTREHAAAATTKLAFAKPDSPTSTNTPSNILSTTQDRLASPRHHLASPTILPRHIIRYNDVTPDVNVTTTAPQRMTAQAQDSPPNGPTLATACALIKRATSAISFSPSFSSRASRMQGAQGQLIGCRS